MVTFQDAFNQGQAGVLENRQRQLALQNQQDDQAAMALLGNAFGMPAPPPPGQASQPPAPPPQAMQPPMPPQGVPPQAPPPQVAPRPAPPAIATPPQGPPPQQSPSFPGSSPPPPMPQQQPALPTPPRPQVPQGPMSLDQLKNAILSNPRNAAAVQQNPALLVRALEKGAALLAPEARAQLAAAKQDLANQQLAAKIDMFKQHENDTAQSNAAKDALRLQIAQLTDSRARDLLMERLLADKDKTATTEAGKDRRAATMNLGKLTAAATKAGVTIEDTDTAETIQKKTAEAVAKKFASATMPPETVAFVGDAALTDPSILSHAFVGRSDATAANKNAVLAYIAKKASPEVLAQAKVALGEKQGEARAEGAIAGTTAVGAQEIEQFAPLVLSDANKVNLGRFPSINAWNLWAKKQSGDDAVIKYADNLQALQNAASLVLTRGGKMSDQARKLTQALAEGTLAPMQLKAAIQALREEAKGTGAAAKAATAGTVGSIKTPGSAPGSDVGGGNPAPGGDQPSADDPLGILQ